MDIVIFFLNNSTLHDFPRTFSWQQKDLMTHESRRRSGLFCLATDKVGHTSCPSARQNRSFPKMLCHTFRLPIRIRLFLHKQKTSPSSGDSLVVSIRWTIEKDTEFPLQTMRMTSAKRMKDLITSRQYLSTSCRRKIRHAGKHGTPTFKTL